MIVGKMDRHIRIERARKQQRGTGESFLDWSDPEPFAEVWADKRDQGGKEDFSESHLVGEHDAKFFIYYLKGLNTEMRIVFDGQIFDIKYINEIGRREGMEILAKRLESTDGS